MNYLVSVIVNCHNGEKYLKKAVQSVLQQNYKNWELIFWDNNSSDSSEKILKSFKDKRIKYFKSKDFTSLCKARNLAIKKAKGKYITFLDTDDMWKKNKLTKQVNFVKKNKEYKIIYSNYIVKKNKKYFKMFRKNLSSGFVTQKLLNNYSIGLLTVMIEKSIFNFKKFNRKYNIIGDFDFFIKASVSNKIAYIDEPLAIYRIHGNNYSLKNLKEFIFELSYWLKNSKKKFNKMNFYLLFQYYLLIKLKIKFLIRN